MNKENEVRSFIMAEGTLVPEEVDKRIAQLSSQCPDARAAELGITSDVDRAYETIQIMRGVQTDVTKVTETTVPAAGATQPETVSSNELNAIQRSLLDQAEALNDNSATTTIEAFIFDRPEPAEYIQAGTKGEIQEKGWKNILAKIESGEYKVLPDDPAGTQDAVASTSNFNALKAAAESGTPVDVYIGKASTRPIGYDAVIQNAVGSDMVRQPVTREKMLNYVALYTAGYIMAQPGKPGLRLRVTSSKNNQQIPGQKILATPVLVDCNKASAMESGAYQVSREVSNDPAKPTACKSALCFRVQTNQKKSNGDGYKVRMIRASLKADLPVLVRKPAYIDTFGTGEKESNQDMLKPPTEKQINTFTEAQSMAIAMIQRKANDASTMRAYREYNDRLSSFAPQQAQAPAGTSL